MLAFLVLHELPQWKAWPRGAGIIPEVDVYSSPGYVHDGRIPMCKKYLKTIHSVDKKRHAENRTIHSHVQVDDIAIQ